MIYKSSATQWNFMCIPYGSKLYGTSTAASDTDEKAIYVPSLDSLLLGHKPRIYKERVDANGCTVPDGASMPASGVETEYIPIQTFVRDFVQGQTYALEVAYAYLGFGCPKPGPIYTSEKPVYNFIKELVDKFSTAEVHSMVGFAMKQTFDYVHRGQRLNEAQKVFDVLTNAVTMTNATGELRLDTRLPSGQSILDFIVEKTGLKIGSSVNNKKEMRTLELNGRSYLETTQLSHLINLVDKLINSYGERTSRAAKSDVDYKSLSHAVRVYQQAIELLDTGKITFPRPNAEFLLAVKQGKVDLEEVKALLHSLDEEVQEKVKSSTIRRRTPELDAAAEEWLLEQLHDLYWTLNLD